MRIPLAAKRQAQQDSQDHSRCYPAQTTRDSPANHVSTRLRGENLRSSVYLLHVAEEATNTILRLEEVGDLQLVVCKRFIFLHLLYNHFLLDLHVAYGPPHCCYCCSDLLLASHLPVRE